jgi:hypothetical protein
MALQCLACAGLAQQLVLLECVIHPEDAQLDSGEALVSQVLGDAWSAPQRSAHREELRVVAAR